MSKRFKVISPLFIILLILILGFSVKKKEKVEKQNLEDYSKLAILVNGIPSTNIPIDKYYYLSNSCNGMKLEWNVLEKKLKIKGVETIATNPSCTLNFEEIAMDIKVDEVTNFNPTGVLIISEKNCGDSEVTYSNNKLNIKLNTKPAMCTIKLITPPYLYNKILANNTSQSDASINFDSITGDGLYYTDNNTYGEDNTRIYYFRGRVDNNWVNFGGYLWRIVRTTSEGGVKLAYSGNGSTASSAFINTSTAFNINYNKKYYVGYTYNLSGYTGTQTDGTIKTVIDTWYTNNLSSYESYLSDTAIYCADRSSESGIYYPIYDRIVTNKRPTYACASANASRYTVSTETGNGYLQKPIALLTADEINYAGVSSTSGNQSLNSYIMDNATGVSYWWTISPDAFSASKAYGYSITSSGYLRSLAVGNAYGVRSSVSLKSCVIVTEGNGNKSTPYVLSNSFCT